jgi:PUA-domain protein
MKLRKSSIRELSEQTKVEISKKSEVEERDSTIFVDRVPYFFRYEGRLVPTLYCLKNNNILPKITIDTGAVKFLIKGADMMRPGITDFMEFAENDFIAVVGPTADIPIGVGIALMNSEDAKNASSGKIMKTLHYTGDSIWNLSQG